MIPKPIPCPPWDPALARPPAQKALPQELCDPIPHFLQPESSNITSQPTLNEIQASLLSRQPSRFLLYFFHSTQHPLTSIFLFIFSAPLPRYNAISIRAGELFCFYSLSSSQTCTWHTADAPTRAVGWMNDSCIFIAYPALCAWNALSLVPSSSWLQAH